MSLHTYPSAAALAQDFKSRGCTGVEFSTSRSWFNNESTDDSLRLALTGDVSLVPDAEKLMSSLDAQVETSRRAWEASPVGPFCVIPEALAGLPTPMRRPILVEDDRAPISIYACTTSSAGVDAKVLQRRGTAILALVLALSRLRPVTLHAIGIGNGVKDGETIVTCQINTAPLDLATACYVLTSAGFTRRLMYSLAKRLNGFSGRWPRNRFYSYGKPDAYYDHLRDDVLGLSPENTLMIQAAQLNDELVTQPVAWINRQVARFAHQEEE